MPFNGQPPGLSVAVLELLDQGLKEIWHEMQVAADAKTRDAAATNDRPVHLHTLPRRTRKSPLAAVRPPTLSQ